MMEGIVTVAIDPVTIPDEKVVALDAEMRGIGLESTLPATEGGTLSLPFGNYGRIIGIEDQMAQLKHYYGSVVAAMRKVGIAGRYFVNVSQKPAFVCGEL